MNFLSQLRQNRPDPAQSLHLCYLFELQPFTNTLKLRLCLTNLRDCSQDQPHSGQQQGLLLTSAKPYQLQRAHLQHPPPFMELADNHSLALLTEYDPRWLQQSYGHLAVNNYAELLTAVLATGRCFIKTRHGDFQKLHMENAIPVSLAWTPNHIGDYQLGWQMNTVGRLLCVDENNCCPVVYNASTGSLSLTLLGLSSLALETLKQTPWIISTADASMFEIQQQPRWDKMGLPTLKINAGQEVSAMIEPVLCLSSRSLGQNKQRLTDTVCLQFRYTSDNYCTCIDYGAEQNSLTYFDGNQLNQLIRQPDQEQQIHQQLQAILSALAGFDIDPNQLGWRCSNAKSWQTLLAESRPQLEQQGFRFHISPDFRHHYVLAAGWQVNIAESNDQQLQLSLMVELDGLQINLLKLLQQLHAQNANYTSTNTVFKLEDGRLLLLPTRTTNGIMEELGDLLLKQPGSVRFPSSQMNRLNGLFDYLPDNTQWQGATDHLDLAVNLHQAPVFLEHMQRSVNAELRPYQWLGVCWLQHLKQHRANGLLADDMGLGKTLQTLANLSIEQQQGHLQNPALIVAPTSLLHNWSAEIRKFTPGLRYKVMHGPKRHESWEKLADYDVIISSYALMVKDLSHWQRQSLSWIILDEAQHIGNPRTQASRSLRQLKSEHRLCLSGTPVQNHLGELWSLLDFLMPGCLGGYSDFRQYYQRAIEQDANSQRMQQLQKRIAPFMLRRSKNQVAKDLPAKTEIFQHISLADDQQRFYEEQKNVSETDIQLKLVSTEHAGQRQMLLITALLRLRQACCDPALLGNFSVSSAKRGHCIKMVQELVEEDRRILIFSQFTSMLDLLAQDLQNLGIQYLMLTGQSRNRQQLVEQFQQGQTPVFLISLKAGGVGLNLTSADTVIHYDPWWNLAAEQQASNRAHRIGQDKPVFVYKLIAKGTIEEKIALLQQHKAQVSQHIEHQASLSGEQFSLKLEELLRLWQQETNDKVGA